VAPDANVLWISGEFEVIGPPARLVYTWRIGAEQATTRVTVRFSRKARQTRARFEGGVAPSPVTKHGLKAQSLPMSKIPDTILFSTPGTCALSCVVALEWAGEPYRLCRLSREERGSEAYQRVNPRGQVPAMSLGAGGARRILVEANAVLANIAARERGRELLPPHGTPERDLANQWLAYLASGFHASFWPYFRPERYTTEEAHQASAKAAGVLLIRRELAHIENTLGDAPFVLGEKRSLLDGYLYAMARWSAKIVDLPGEFPRVAAFQQRLAADPAVAFGVAMERSADVDLTGHACTGFVTLAEFLG